MIRKTRFFLAAVAGLALTLPSWAQTSTWKIDSAHSSAQFSVRHLMISNVRGEFARVEGALQLDENDITRSSAEATIDANSLNTREARRDTHLKSADFFDVANHPTIRFQSRKVEKAGEGALRVTGDLTIRGVTKEVVLDVEGPTPAITGTRGEMRRGATATTRINRQDFGVSWNRKLDAGGVVVGDEVKITIDLELVKQAESAASNSK